MASRPWFSNRSLAGHLCPRCHVSAPKSSVEILKDGIHYGLPTVREHWHCDGCNWTIERTTNDYAMSVSIEAGCATPQQLHFDLAQLSTTPSRRPSCTRSSAL